MIPSRWNGEVGVVHRLADVHRVIRRIEPSGDGRRRIEREKPGVVRPDPVVVDVLTALDGRTIRTAPWQRHAVCRQFRAVLRGPFPRERHPLHVLDGLIVGHDDDDVGWGSRCGLWDRWLDDGGDEQRDQHADPSPSPDPTASRCTRCSHRCSPPIVATAASGPARSASPPWCPVPTLDVADTIPGPRSGAGDRRTVDRVLCRRCFVTAAERPPYAGTARSTSTRPVSSRPSSSPVSRHSSSRRLKALMPGAYAPRKVLPPVGCPSLL